VNVNLLRSVSPCATGKAGAILLQDGLLDNAVSVAVVLRHFFAAIGLATVIALGWTQRAQAPNAVLGLVDGGFAEGDGMHGVARTEAIGGDRGSGAEMWSRATRTEARGGGGCGGAEMRDQAEHVIAVMGELIESTRKEVVGSL